MKLRKVTELIAEKFLMLCSSVTTLTVILIVIFLFSEGMGLFKSSDIEEGYALVVNSENPVSKLSPEQIMEVFDSKVTLWSEVGGNDEPILLFRLNDLPAYFTEEEMGDELQYVPQCIGQLVSKEPGIIAFVPKMYVDSTASRHSSRSGSAHTSRAMPSPSPRASSEDSFFCTLARRGTPHESRHFSSS